MASEKVVKKKRFLNLKTYFAEVCRSSTIHGLKFLGEPNRSVLERIWWVVFIGLSLFYVTDFIATTHKKWMNSPVIVTFATSETPIYEIPFPAVTICPLVKIDPNKFYFNETHHLDSVRFEDVVYASLVCPQFLIDYPQINYVETVEKTALDFLLNMSINPNVIFLQCTIAGHSCDTDPYPSFRPIMTSGGICYSFNLLGIDDIYTQDADIADLNNIGFYPNSTWSLDNGYRKKIGIDTYPRRSVLTGSNGGLELTLGSYRQKQNNLCEHILNGFKVILHHPGKIPRFDERDILVPLDELVSIGVKPNMISTARVLRKYNPRRRKCYLENEHQLEFFKTYDQQNCLEECLSHYALMKCDCVGFYMPRRNTTPICGPSQYDCLNEARIEFVIRDSEYELISKSYEIQFSDVRGAKGAAPTKKPKRPLRKPNCKCLPSCFSLTYDTETSQMEWDWHNSDNLKQRYNKSKFGLSRVAIFYKDLQFMSSERNELYGESEFWANCGGLLGLFTGFSLLSAVELLYFLTLRLYCNIRKFGIKHWSGSNEENR